MAVLVSDAPGAGCTWYSSCCIAAFACCLLPFLSFLLVWFNSPLPLPPGLPLRGAQQTEDVWDDRAILKVRFSASARQTLMNRLQTVNSRGGSVDYPVELEPFPGRLTQGKASVPCPPTGRAAAVQSKIMLFVEHPNPPLTLLATCCCSRAESLANRRVTSLGQTINVLRSIQIYQFSSSTDDHKMIYNVEV